MSYLLKGGLLRSKPNDQQPDRTLANRNLDYPSFIGIASLLSLPLSIFYVVPNFFTVLNGPESIISYAIAAFVILISAYHFKELFRLFPKSCVLYEATYLVYGEFVAHLTGWMYIFDSVIYTVIIAKLWSTYADSFFRQLLRPPFLIDYQGIINFPYIEKSYDCLSLAAVVVSSLASLCEYQVFGTVSISVAIVMLFTTISTSLVGYAAHNLQHLSLEELKLNNEVLSCASYFYCSFFGIETLSMLYNGTPAGRKRILKLPMITCCLTIIIVTIVLMVYLYFVTVGAVCGLSGAVIIAAIPSAAMLAALTEDRLVPLYSSATKKVVKVQIALVMLLSGTILVSVKESLLFAIIRLNSNVRLLILACLVVSTRLDGDIVEFAYTTEYSKLNRGNLNSQFLSSDALTV
ncbi:unnamed protein product [Enterobius vermicularis]|uniref:Aa_trans domain-containing protein n=1 Tax=Enterobius vermicularis TaxID=51028 RepID=A0A158QAB6_ENTVE|nr:unnamed protein product [Enterobius vermicularis]